MAEKDIRLSILLRNFIDGVPLDLASKLLPPTTKLNLTLLSHIHLHAQNQKRMANKKIDKKKYKLTKFQMILLIRNLETTIKNLNLKNVKTEWEKYYSFTNYDSKAFSEKHRIVENFIKIIKPKSVLDLGANTGEFSKLAVSHNAYTIASDIDPLAVEACFKSNPDNKNLLPVLFDLTNPSPAIGWANSERKSFSQRFQVDLVMALALIHHLVISNKLPFDIIAKYFSQLGKYLIIEFVPKDDSKVRILLQNREDIFKEYTKEYIEKTFTGFYKIIKSEYIKSSKRIIYLMEKR